MAKSDNGTRGLGRLMIIGGGEDRSEGKEILTRFVELCGGPQASIAIVTAASTLHEEMREIYDRAFAELGVTRRPALALKNREMANDQACAEKIYECDGIFMTGGDQKRLMAVIGGTLVAAAMHRALREHGTCIGGTSAGASAMSEHMLSDGKSGGLPQKGTTQVGAGLGFLRRVMIDQHFSERQRLGRLLSAIAANPYLLGVGIDENTALIVELNSGLEVLGQGAVTIIDGREVMSNLPDVSTADPVELINVRMHLLRPGFRYSVHGEEQQGRKVSPALEQIIPIVTNFHQ